MKILTAIGNNLLRERLEEENFDVYKTDLQYQEAVLHILKENNKINILFLNSILPGDLSIYEFINNIIKINPKIKIIIILENKNDKLINYLNSKNIFDIFYNNKTKIEDLIFLLNPEKNNYNKKTKNKINKKIIKKITGKILKKIKTNNLLKNLIIKNKNKLLEKNKIINILGAPGVGKTVFTIVLAILLKNKKILIIDCDENKNINKILNIKNKKNNIEEIKYKNNIYVLNINKKIFTEKEAEKLIKENLKKYEIIIIDTSNNNFKKILKQANLNLFLVESNLIEINKTKIMLENFVRENNLKKEDVKLVFNKYNTYSISFSILKEIFCEYSIVGKIVASDRYNLLINKDIKTINEEMKKEYKKILKKECLYAESIN